MAVNHKVVGSIPPSSDFIISFSFDSTILLFPFDLIQQFYYFLFISFWFDSTSTFFLFHFCSFPFDFLFLMIISFWFDSTSTFFLFHFCSFPFDFLFWLFPYDLIQQVRFFSFIFVQFPLISFLYWNFTFFLNFLLIQQACPIFFFHLLVTSLLDMPLYDGRCFRNSRHSEWFPTSPHIRPYSKFWILF